jgi:hypothetical protein
MDGMTQQNAALVEQAAAASQAIVEQTHSLSAMVARYRIGEHAGRHMDIEHDSASEAA